jgi:hypothetical protein
MDKREMIDALEQIIKALQGEADLGGVHTLQWGKDCTIQLVHTAKHAHVFRITLFSVSWTITLWHKRLHVDVDRSPGGRSRTSTAEWTIRTPVQPGWYWLRALLSSTKSVHANPIVVWVSRKNGRTYIATGGGEPQKAVPGSLWCGPLYAPPVGPKVWQPTLAEIQMQQASEERRRW